MPGIMIVDDNMVDAMELKDALAANGYDFRVIAYSCTEAVEIARHINSAGYILKFFAFLNFSIQHF